MGTRTAMMAGAPFINTTTDMLDHVDLTDPRARYPETERLCLAPRPVTPNVARFCLIQTMPPGNGLEPAIDAVEAELRRRYPDALINRLMRRDFLIDDAGERETVTQNNDTAIVFAGPSATLVHVSWLYTAALERGGLPCAIAHFREFEAGAAHLATSRAAPLRHAAMPGPEGDDRAYVSFADTIIEALLAPLASRECESGHVRPTPFAALHQHTDAEAAHKHFRQLGLSDGAPIVLPTKARVAEMLTGTSRAPHEVVTAHMRPEGLVTTVEMVAANAVMAGASPLHLPLILAAISLYGAVELESMTRSVNSFAFAHLVSAPLAQRLEISGALNALSPSLYPNNVVARAIALCVRNCGAQVLGVTASPTQGNAIGTLVFAENAEESPWPPFHVAEGYAPDAETVSLFAGGFNVCGTFYYRDLEDVALAMAQFEGTSLAMAMLSPKRAKALAARGFDRAGIADTLWRRATLSLGAFRSSGFAPMMKALMARAKSAGTPTPWPEDYFTRPDEDIVPVYPRAGVKVTVVGGAAASVIQLWNFSHSQTADVTPWR